MGKVPEAAAAEAASKSKETGRRQDIVHDLSGRMNYIRINITITAENNPKDDFKLYLVDSRLFLLYFLSETAD